MPKTLKYGGVQESESEVIIRLDKVDRLAYVNSTWPEWSRKFERLHGTPSKYVEISGVVQSAFWTLPLETIRIRKGKAIRTEAQLERSRMALQNARISLQAPKNDPLLAQTAVGGYVGSR